MARSTRLAVAPGLEVATVAGGCFWGLEYVYKKYFGPGSGVLDCVVGYCNGNTTAQPTYRDVCAGKTTHAEAIQVLYDPRIVSYKRILEFFFRIHDPTQLGHQGPDNGIQYRSGIYTTSPQQESDAKAVLEKVQPLFRSKIVTEVLPLQDWWDAEDYHQNYLNMNPGGYECPTHYFRGRFGEWVAS